MTRLAENWPYPKTRGKRATRPEDQGLPQDQRRCLSPEHTGVVILPIDCFPDHPSTPKGKRYICCNCFAIRRRSRNKFASIEDKRETFDWGRPFLRAMATHGFYNVIADPTRTFKGMFGLYDFSLSFDGRVWPEGTIVQDKEGSEYTVQYTPIPALIRSDGVVFEYWKRDINRMGFRERSNG